MYEYEELFGGDNMPLRGKGQKSTQFMKGLSSVQVAYADIAQDDIDTDLTSVVASNTQLASSKAIKDYVDSVTLVDTVDEMTDTTISGVGDNNHFQYDGSTGRWVNRTFVDFSKIAEPNDPSTEEGRLYLKQLDANNNALAIKLQKAGNMVEVELTSPGCVCECGSTDGAKDPIYNFAEGIMIVELYCGHSYEMSIPNLRRIK